MDENVFEEINFLCEEFRRYIWRTRDSAMATSSNLS